MPRFFVRLEINIPTLGKRIIQIPNVDAPNAESAIQTAKAGITIETIEVHQLPDHPA